MADNRTYGGQQYNVSVLGTAANWHLTSNEKDTLMQAIISKGGPLTDSEIYSLGLYSGTDDGLKMNAVRRAMTQLYENNKSVLNTSPAAAPTREDAFNAYYNDLYSLKDGTSGQAMLGRLEDVYQNQATGALQLADANYQTQALQQAQTVKAITDQVRAERMNRLRAGMNESQIANQDMQMMMANVNAVNQNAQLMNQGRLTAQIGMNQAQDQAYTDYLAQSTARGQVATGMYAADSGNPTQVALRNLQIKFPNGGWTSADYDREYATTINSTKQTT